MTSVLALNVWAIYYNATEAIPKGPDMFFAHVDIAYDWQCPKDKVLPWGNIYCSWN